MPVRVRTRLFGTLALPLTLESSSTAKAAARRWSRSLAFPGLRAGASAHRRTTLPAPRDAARARRQGAGREPARRRSGRRAAPARRSGERRRRRSRPDPGRAAPALEAEGVPADAEVGIERPRAGARRPPARHARAASCSRASSVLASRRAARGARRAHDDLAAGAAKPRSPRSAASSAGSSRCSPPPAQILAVAGIGLDGLQPPGSTFKIVTLAGVLDAHIATPHTVFPYATYATLDGVTLNNANGEECGGSLELAFAVSCNSVFAPLGVKLGAPRLVATAERFGFNQDPGVPGAARSSLPAADAIQGELAVGSTAIGQGEVLATPLQMATVAADDRRRRPPPGADASCRARRAPAPRRVEPAEVARTVRHLMTEVVRAGHRHLGRDPRRRRRRQDRHRRTEDPCSPTPAEARSAAKPSSRSRHGEGCDGARQRPEQHRRLVRGVRPGAPPADRRLRAARQRRRRRRHGGAGRARGARSRPARAGRAGAQTSSSAEAVFGGRRRGFDDPELERPVVERDDLDLEQQQRALRGPERRRSCRRRAAGLCAGTIAAAVGEVVGRAGRRSAR